MARFIRLGKVRCGSYHGNAKCKTAENQGGQSQKSAGNVRVMIKSKSFNYFD